MTDPVSLIALGAAVGGATSKFTEKAWDAGQKWLSSFFADHNENARQQAMENSAAFLNELAMRIRALEESSAVSKKQIDTAQDHPQFSIMLQKALLTAAQTDDKDKHKLLARLLADRLKSESESLFTLASKMACESISFMTPTQLQILGLISSVTYMKPLQALTKEQYQQHLSYKLKPFAELNFDNLDLVHLEALSCLKFEPTIGPDLAQLLTHKNDGTFDNKAFKVSGVGKAIIKLWEQHKLGSVLLTSVGQLIGIYVSDNLTATTTDFAEWNSRV